MQFSHILCLVTLWIHIIRCSGNLNQTPRQIIDAYQLGLGFVGNRNVTDYFKLLKLDRQHLLVGARNAVYNISMIDFSVQKSIIWPSTEESITMCHMKGKSQDACHNYVRVLAKEDDGSILVCGTNAYNPTCRIYENDQEGNFVQSLEFQGHGLSPYDPKHNSTFFYDSTSRKLYAGTVADFKGDDALVYRRDVNHPEQLGLRTERRDKKVLNDPDFVGAFEDDNHVYFWLREDAVEYSNCGKASYSRVARVCKKDSGSSVNTWTSFLKTRLNCSLPGNYPFYFDRIEAMTAPVAGRYGQRGTDLVYAVFNTPYSGMQGSAICAFSMDEVRQIFTESPFKGQNTPDSKWTQINENDVPDPRPGQCSRGNMAIDAVNFVKKNPLMNDAVPNFFKDPILGQALLDDYFTQIAVDPQVTTIAGIKFDVLFIGTQKGNILKVVNVVGESSLSEVQGVLVEIVHVFSDQRPIRNLLLYRNPDESNSIESQLINEPQLVVVGDHEVRRLPVHHCARVSSCTACVKLQDPYCAWDKLRNACVWSYFGRWSDNQFLQNVLTGVDPGCPIDNAIHSDVQEYKAAPHSGDTFARLAMDNVPPRDSSLCSCPTSTGSPPSSTSSTSYQYVYDSDGYGATVHESPVNISGIYTAQSMTLAVIITICVSALCGFMVGCLCSKRVFGSKSVSGPPSRSLSPPLSNNHHNHNGSAFPRSTNLDTPCSKALNGGVINAYEATPKLNIESPHPPVSLVLDLDDKPINTSLNGSVNGIVFNNPYSTLPKDYRVKRIYL